MSYIGNVKVDSATHLVGSTLYGTCNTAAGTKEKAVVCTNFDKLLTGVTIHVKFDNTNSIADPTLNVNNTGAKAIKRYGTTAPSTSVQTSWYAGAVISFTYDGTYWMMDDWTYTADGNDTSQLRSYYSHPTAGGNGIKQYSLFARLADGTYSSFTTNSGTGTKTFDTTNYFDINKIYYANRSSDLASGSVMGNDQMSQQMNLVDCRYTFNGITTSSGFTANKPVYLMFSYASGYVQSGIYAADTLSNHYKLYIKDNKIWTHEPFSVVTYEDMSDIIIFVLIGFAYDSYRISLLEQNIAYLYNGDSLLPFTERTTAGFGCMIMDGTSYQIGTCATAEGFMNFPIGAYSHTEGRCCIANGNQAHAEGLKSVASGDNSHAEGNNTVAQAIESHAEGSGAVAYGAYSHAEGYGTRTNGLGSHAEGHGEQYYGYTSGNYSHVEGYNCVASGANSHAEGYYTDSYTDNQHVEGKYNIVDTSGTYAHIIGGGTSNSDRKNIFTVSWDGDVTAGRSTGIENSNKLVTGADIYSGGLAPLDYSITEQATGKHWIDGKEIYQLTVDFGYMPTAQHSKTAYLMYNTTTYIPIETVVNYIPMITKGDNFIMNFYSGANADNTGCMNIYIAKANLQSTQWYITTYAYSDRSSYRLYLTLWYTKTS